MLPEPTVTWGFGMEEVPLGPTGDSGYTIIPVLGYSADSPLSQDSTLIFQKDSQLPYLLGSGAELSQGSAEVFGALTQLHG